MLQVRTPEEVLALIRENFAPISDREERVSLDEAVDRVLSRDVQADRYVPDFNRSTVDGYACRACDTFGCSEAIPAILSVEGEILMGQEAAFELKPGCCAYVPTGGAIPVNADCAVMIEYTEDYGDGTVGLFKPAAPGMNLIFRGDDVCPGQVILRAGRKLTASDIGALAAVGVTDVPVWKKLLVAVISTGDELVPPEQEPGPGQVRDVNTPMLTALLREWGADVRVYGILRDDEEKLRETVKTAAASCDAVLLSGGSSVGVKDAACRIIESMGELLLHGIAVKPGKPTILGKSGNKPLVGLPGHPVAACFVTKLFVRPLLDRLAGQERERPWLTAVLSESVSANHGRAQVNACRLERRGGELVAVPIRSKSGLITQLAGADGFFVIDRDSEGLPKGGQVQVYLD